MRQDTYNLWSLIVSAATAAVVIWYTIETRKMQRAVTQQARELARQIRLSIMPAFTIEFVAVRDEHQSKIMQASLTNIGNGTAVCIEVDRLALAHSVNVHGPYEFKQISTLACGESKLLEKTEASLPSFTNFEVASKVFTLTVRFQDIEGNQYKQEIFMDKNICKPRPVATITASEAGLQEKALVIQDAEPSGERFDNYK